MMKIEPRYKRAILDAFGWRKSKDGTEWYACDDRRYLDKVMMTSEDGPFLDLVKINDTLHGRKKLLAKLDWEYQPPLIPMTADALYTKGKINMTSEWMGNACFAEFISAAITGWPNFISVDALANDICNEIKKQANDNINHPSHYTDGKIEVADFITDKGLNFCRGNVVKYVARAGKKDPKKEIEDLKKARWYIDREIRRMEESK